MIKEGWNLYRENWVRYSLIGLLLFLSLLTVYVGYEYTFGVMISRIGFTPEMFKDFSQHPELVPQDLRLRLMEFYVFQWLPLTFVFLLLCLLIMTMSATFIIKPMRPLPFVKKSMIASLSLFILLFLAVVIFGLLVSIPLSSETIKTVIGGVGVLTVFVAGTFVLYNVVERDKGIIGSIVDSFITVKEHIREVLSFWVIWLVVFSLIALITEVLPESGDLWTYVFKSIVLIAVTVVEYLIIFPVFLLSYRVLSDEVYLKNLRPGTSGRIARPKTARPKTKPKRSPSKRKVSKRKTRGKSKRKM